jgi:hypothetical protein
MKKILLSLVAIATLSLSSFGQAPEGFKYQAVVRDAGNLILNNQAVGLRMTIQQGAIGGTTIYSETFAPTTNSYGLINLEIGNGTVVSGTFANIDWSAGPYFMESAVDVTGGTNYSVMGTSQLMSVPYALYAKTSGNGQGPAGPQGNQGPAGVDGTNGTNGTDGVIGTAGPQGIQGPAGATGATGSTGAIGIQGLPGTNGAVGATGPQGNQGLPGTNGAVGPQGPAGNDGAAGAQGNQGLPGTNGAVGPQGPAGNDGAAGAQGNQGLPGTNGAVGPQGSAGNDGAAGAQGNQGLPGTNGAAGADGQGGVTTAGSGINVTGAGTAASPYLVSTTGPTYTIGLWPELGGYVFWVSADGKHGLVAETQDQGFSSWYVAQNLISDPSNHSVNGQKFRDWRLPTKYELNEIYLQRVAIGGFVNNNYWSSTENEVSAVTCGQFFFNGNQGNFNNYSNLCGRSVRAF